MGLGTFYGRFGKETGTLNFDPASPEISTLSARIDMTVVQTHVDELDSEQARSDDLISYSGANARPA